METSANTSWVEVRTLVFHSSSNPGPKIIHLCIRRVCWDPWSRELYIACPADSGLGNLAGPMGRNWVTGPWSSLVPRPPEPFHVPCIPVMSHQESMSQAATDKEHGAPHSISGPPSYVEAEGLAPPAGFGWDLSFFLLSLIAVITP